MRARYLRAERTEIWWLSNQISPSDSVDCIKQPYRGQEAGGIVGVVKIRCGVREFVPAATHATKLRILANEGLGASYLTPPVSSVS